LLGDFVNNRVDFSYIGLMDFWTIIFKVSAIISIAKFCWDVALAVYEYLKNPYFGFLLA
jgi:hypothetical protein